MSTISNAQDASDKDQKDIVQASTSVVTGRAVFEDSAQPATRYRIQLVATAVLLNPLGTHRIPTVLTDQNGEFSLRRIAAGEYYVVARPIDEHARSGQLFPLPTGDSATDAAKVKQFKKENLRIAVDGLHNVELNLRLPNPHFGTISGRVLDDQGRPAARASVHLMRKDESSFGASVLTNEQGEYKFLGLPAGDYIISASPPAKERTETTIRTTEGLPGATYFPSSLRSADSPPVTVLPDRDRGDVVITLINRKLYSLAGIVRMKTDSRPVTNAVLRLSVIKLADDSATTSNSTGIESAMSNYFTSPDNNGHWTFANVPDGSYRLFVQPKAGERSKQQFVQKEQELIVEGADVEDLVIDVSEGTRISGTLILEGNSPSPQFIRVAASQYNKGPANSSARIDGPGSFALTAVPTGEIQVSAFVYPQDKFYVKSIEANGKDLLRNNLTIAEGEEIQDVNIVVSSNVGVVTGRVVSANGDRPISGVNVALRRIGDDKPRLYGGKLTALSDEGGNFRISGAPGVYLVVAWRTQGGPAFSDAMDKAQREQAPGITLSAGETKQLEIRMP